MIDKLNQGIGSLDLHALEYLVRRLNAAPTLEILKEVFPAKHEAVRARRRYQLSTILEFSMKALRANEGLKAELGETIYEITHLVQEVKSDSALLDLGYNSVGVFAKIEVDQNDRQPRPLEGKYMMLLCIALIDTLVKNETLAQRMREISRISGTSVKSLKYNQTQMQKSPTTESEEHGSDRNRRYSTKEHDFYLKILDLTGYYEDDETKLARRLWLQDHISMMRKSGSSSKPKGRPQK